MGGQCGSQTIAGMGGQCGAQTAGCAHECASHAKAVPAGLRASLNTMPSVGDLLQDSHAECTPNVAPKCAAHFEATAAWADSCASKSFTPSDQSKLIIPGASLSEKYKYVHEDDAELGSYGFLPGFREELDSNLNVFKLIKTVEPPTIKKKYTLEEEALGIGSFGKFVRGFCKATGIYHAVKITPKHEKKRTELENRAVENRAREEVRILKLTNHQNIVSFVESFEDGCNIYLIVGLCKGGALSQLLRDAGHFTELESLALLRQTLEAVKYLHDILLCHRDLRPENLLLETRAPIQIAVLKLIDFGSACDILPGTKLSGPAGTPYFMAPEVIDDSYTEACDIWSCGVLFYLFLCGCQPFEAPTVQGIYAKIKQGNFNLQAERRDSVSKASKDLLCKLLKHMPEERLTAESALSSKAIEKRTPVVEYV